ncbi:MAG: molybdopterin-guanine dinucleotide biosynthesis protein MobB [Pedobacter sp.]|nr:MAG: molybdopterin-guanine dinucleotide biosynthesis protein MobB [Pedobacter sp.]
MFINITGSETGNNKGSSGQLVHYLDKENRLFDQDPEFWFNGENDDIRSYKVKHALDNNIAKLCRDDAKFFLVNINPSQKEIAFLNEEFGEEEMGEGLKEFCIKVMDEYAKNFNRPGIESEKDLLWFGKLENHRYYTHKDAEVKSRTKKRGEAKPGKQMHVQIIVSRKDITNTIKLSPMNKSRGRNLEHSKKLGQFNRVAFKESGEKLFDQYFGFDRGLKDTFHYANVQKNGTVEQKVELERERMQSSHESKKERDFAAPANQTEYLDILLKEEYHDDTGSMVVRKKRAQSQERGI